MANRFYPTPSDVKCYIGNIELDDIFRVDFKRQINHQPVYGYNSQQFDFVAKGKELVNGQIVINFRYPGYLTAAIEKSKKEQVNNSDVYTDEFDVSKTNSALADIEKNAVDGMSPIEKTKYIANKLKAGYLTNQDIVDQIKYNLDKSYGVNTGNVLEKATVFDSPLDRSTDKYTFDMMIKYGNHDKDAGFYRVFTNCVLVGESSTYSAAAGAGNDMSSSAQPIFEIYPFFAKTVTVVSRTARNISKEVDELKGKLNTR